MKIIILAFHRSLFAEPIHIELPDERCEVGVLKIDGQDALCKFFDAIYHEPDPIIMPGDDILVGCVLRL